MQQTVVSYVNEKRPQIEPIEWYMNRDRIQVHLIIDKP